MTSELKDLYVMLNGLTCNEKDILINNSQLIG